MKSLRLLGTVGEPINPEAWMWYRSIIGHDRCPIVDTWWQTETGRDDDQPAAGRDADEAGLGTRPLPGVKAEVVTREGKPVPAGSGGYLVIRKPWPSMLRTIYGDPERYQAQYWSQIPGVLFHRRRRAPGQGRLFLDHGPHRRRDQRVGTSAQHDGSGVRAGRASESGRSRRGGTSRRDQRVRRSWRSSLCRAAIDADRRIEGRVAHHGSARRSARSPSPTISGSPIRCRKPAAGRSCGGCCGRSRPAATSKAT